MYNKFKNMFARIASAHSAIPTRLSAVSFLTALVLLSISANAVSAEDRAWVWSTYSDTLSHQWTPSLPYQYNSEGGTNVVTHLSLGYYRVDMPNIATDYTPGGGGTALVTAYGGNQTCKPGLWLMDSGGVHLYVYCFSASGSPSDAIFDALWYRRGFPNGFDAYVWANNPTASSYTPASTYQWNSANLNNTIARFGTGTYQVTIPGFSSVGGTVAVSAYGSSSDRCRVVSWYPSSGNLLVNVACTNGNQPHDSLFTLGFTNDMALGGPWWYLGAFAWANQPSNSSCYTPRSLYQFNRYGSALSICRTGLGHYDVHISNFGGVGSGQTTALATAYGGAAGSYCTIQNWSTYSNQWIARVSCYDSGGNSLDTTYTIQFLADLQLPPQ